MTYLIASLKSVRGEYYQNVARFIDKTSLKMGYAARWYNRRDTGQYPEDPWISLGDHPQGIIYGEASSEHLEGDSFKYLEKQGGGKVYVRNQTDGQDSDKCM